MADMKWYVLRTAGSKEKKAAEYLQKEIERSGLQDQVAQVLVPVKKEIVTRNGKRKTVDRLLFPGYVLIQCELDARLENIIRNDVPNMSGFLTESKSMAVNDGPFSGFSGTVEEILEDRSKVKVIVVIFGRKTLLELSFTQVTKE